MVPPITSTVQASPRGLPTAQEGVVAAIFTRLPATWWMAPFCRLPSWGHCSVNGPAWRPSPRRRAPGVRVTEVEQDWIQLERDRGGVYLAFQPSPSDEQLGGEAHRRMPDLAGNEFTILLSLHD